MADPEKQGLTETETRTRYITPAILNAGWDASLVREEFFYTAGRIHVQGKKSIRGEKKRVDYLLHYKPNLPLAVVEAKDNTKPIGAGMQQAIAYAEALDVPFVFTSNGDGFIFHDRTGKAEQVEKELGLDQFPSPDYLFNLWKQDRDIVPSAEPFVLSDYYSDGSDKTPRYYQRIAINRAIEAIGKGDKRILLVMATGTGKTFVAGQIIWRYWKNAQRFGEQKRILFLADRNILVDQTKTNDFKHFGSAMTKITGGKIDKSYEIFLSLYQAVSGAEEVRNIYKQFSRDFFDLIVIDECHRGSAKENSAWREILEYFSSATQLGLTATPKETNDVSTSYYFGDPIYTYSLKEGISDGFLAPYKVIRVAMDKDVFGYRPRPGDLDDNGEVIPDKEFTPDDFDKILVLPSRTEAIAKYIVEYLEKTDPFAKTIVFCRDVDHADRMRKALINASPERYRQNSKYIMRITGDDDEGKRQLDSFIDPESTYPVIAVTSKLMTTGVDAQTCKLIVLDSKIESMTEFKQIIGRGTRVREDYGKTWFTILDFRGVTKLFADPGFDGDPVRVFEPKTPEELDDAIESIDEADTTYNPQLDGGATVINDGSGIYHPTQDGGTKKIVVSGVPVEIIGQRVITLDVNGKEVTESLTDFTRRNILGEYATLDSFLSAWNAAQRRSEVYKQMEAKGIPLFELLDQLGTDMDFFDIILHVAYDRKQIKRKDRVEGVKRSNYLSKYQGKARQVLETLLDLYAETGLETIELTETLKLPQLSSYGRPTEIVSYFGDITRYRQAVREIEDKIYEAIPA